MTAVVRIFSDFVCPYCYLAEFPLDQALAALRRERPELDVVVLWQPFELRPAPNPTLRPEDDYLQQAWDRSVYPLAKAMNVRMRLPTVSPQPHTDLAHEGYQFAKEHGRDRAYTHRLFAGFFQDNLDIGSIDVLADLAADVGLPRDLFREALESRRYRDVHREALRRAYYDEGVHAVPLFRIGDRRFEGLQDAATLRAAIEAAATEAAP